MEKILIPIENMNKIYNYQTTFCLLIHFLMEQSGGRSVHERGKRDPRLACQGFLLTFHCRGWQYSWKTSDWGLYVLFSRVVEALISEASVEIFLQWEEGLSS